MKHIQRLTAADYDDIFALSQFAFQYTLSKEALEAKKAEAARHVIWGWIEQEKIAAKLHVIPLSSYVYGKQFQMGGISSVATWPEYRRQGMVKHLLKHALTYMKNQGMTISFLHPFSFAFYRKFGFELAFANKTYTIPIEYFKNVERGHGYVRRINNDLTPLQAIYHAYAKRFTGPIVRDDQWWRQRVLNKQGHIAVAYHMGGEAEGYLIYDVKNKQMTIQEIAYRSLNGLQLLMTFISHHDSMAENVQLTVPESDQLSFILDEPTIKQQLIPYFMARVVDVHAFLQVYPFKQQQMKPLALHVTDDFFPYNSGTYILHFQRGSIDITFARKKQTVYSSICLNIQALTTIFLGYKRPSQLYNIGYIEGKKEAIHQLEQIIPDQQTFFPDFF